MKKLPLACLLLLSLTTLIAPTYASVRVQAEINQDIHVTFNFENIDNTTYNEIVQQELFNVSTIPTTIKNNFDQQNLKNVRISYDPEQNISDDEAKSIHVSFYLAGSDIITFTINKTTMNRVYNVTTDWRKFSIKLTANFSLNFDKYFDKPVSQWEKINYTDPQGEHPAYYYEYSVPDNPHSSCYFILPATATNVQAIKDIITFEVPPTIEDSLLNSPFLILSALIIVNIAILLYRKVRK